MSKYIINYKMEFKTRPTKAEVENKLFDLLKAGFSLRTVEEQEKLVAAGRSQTMKSKHLKQEDGFCHAVDLMAYVDGEPCWEINVYDDICDAMKEAAKKNNIAVKWGAAWSEGDIRDYPGTAEEAMNKYVDLRRSQGRRPFIDGPHFELMFN